MSCGVGHRHSSDAELLWLRLAAAALIQTLAWELPHARGTVLSKKKKMAKRQKKKEDVAQRHTGTALGLKKEGNSASFSHADGPRDSHTK